MQTPNAAYAPRLEVRASRAMNGCWVFLAVIMIIGLPYLGWTEFGPGAAGDIRVNGNSIWAFWLMRVALAGIWVLCLSGLWRRQNLLRRDPLMFVLDKSGITDRHGRKTPWTEINRVYYVGRAWRLFVQVNPRSGFKDFAISEEEIGFAAMDKVKAFIRAHAHSDMICDF